jgi:hypothetical protein
LGSKPFNFKTCSLIIPAPKISIQPECLHNSHPTP